MVKENNVLKLNGVTDYAVCSYQCRASDEGSVADFSVGSDDAGCSEISRRKNLGSLVYPDVFGYFFIIVSEGRTKGKDHVLDALESLLGIGELAEIILSQSVIKII